MAQILYINPDNPQGRLIDKAVDVLERGGTLVYPTDTVYGLGCDFLNIKAIERIYQIKHRSHKQPLSLMLPSLKQISTYARVSNRAYRLMKRYLPGPYTFVLPATRAVPKKIARIYRGTVGIRIPDHAICLALLARFPNPIISTSANISGTQVLATPVELEEALGSAVDMIIDCGVLGRDASTVVDLTAAEPVILRQGSGHFSG